MTELDRFLDNLAIEVSFLEDDEPLKVAQLALDTNPAELSREAARALVSNNFDGDAAYKALRKKYKT